MPAQHLVPFQIPRGDYEAMTRLLQRVESPLGSFTLEHHINDQVALNSVEEMIRTCSKPVAIAVFRSILWSMSRPEYQGHMQKHCTGLSNASTYLRPLLPLSATLTAVFPSGPKLHRHGRPTKGRASTYSDVARSLT